jgi:hypothetical protein
MKRLLLGVVSSLLGLALAVPPPADEKDGYKKYLKRLQKQQKEQDKFFRKQQKRHEELWREQAKREAELYREQQKHHDELMRERYKQEREYFREHGKRFKFSPESYYGQYSYPLLDQRPWYGGYQSFWYSRPECDLYDSYPRRPYLGPSYRYPVPYYRDPLPAWPDGDDDD